MPDQALAGVGIAAGSLLAADCHLSPVHGCIVVAALDGELLVRRLQRSGQRMRLLSAHPDYPVIEPDYAQDFAIWGVVLDMPEHATFVEHVAIPGANSRQSA